MAISLNRVTLIGNLGADPDIRQMNTGKEVVTLSLATSDSWKDKVTGERKEKTEWHRVVVFNDTLVSFIKSYVKKGAKLYIEGALQTRKWQDNSGQDKYSTEVVLNSFSSQLILLNGSGSETEQQSETKNGSSPAKDFLDDEIPF